MYEDRLHAGRVLKQELNKVLPSLQTSPSYCLLALPRGGVVVAKPIAEQLGVAIDVLVVRKLRHPQQPEVAIGAVMPDGTAILNNALITAHKISEQYITAEINHQKVEIQRRLAAYTGSDKLVSVENKTVLIVDDGIATGYTIQAAIGWLKTQKPQQIIVLIPVAPADVVIEISKVVTKMVCPLLPDRFFAVGMYYKNFSETTDEEVQQILQDNHHRPDIFGSALQID